MVPLHLRRVAHLLVACLALAGCASADAGKAGEVSIGATSDPVTDADRAEVRFADDAVTAGVGRRDDGRVLVDVAGAMSITVTVWWHSVDADDGTVTVSDERTRKQVEVLNDAYRPWDITFVVAGIEHHRSTRWRDAEPGSTSAAEMRTATHHGDRQMLNVWVVTNAELGESSTPVDAGGDSDGVVIAEHAITGSGDEQYGAGDTLVHEAGHWFGLLHTFEGRCTGDGDHVDDTPAQGSSFLDCPEGRDTCPGGGVDPGRNFMGYGDDACMSEFTAGQIDRIRAMWVTYRAPAQP